MRWHRNSILSSGLRKYQNDLVNSSVLVALSTYNDSNTQQSLRHHREPRIAYHLSVIYYIHYVMYCVVTVHGTGTEITNSACHWIERESTITGGVTVQVRYPDQLLVTGHGAALVLTRL